MRDLAAATTFFLASLFVLSQPAPASAADSPAPQAAADRKAAEAARQAEERKQLLADLAGTDDAAATAAVKRVEELAAADRSNHVRPLSLMMQAGRYADADAGDERGRESLIEQGH